MSYSKVEESGARFRMDIGFKRASNFGPNQGLIGDPYCVGLPEISV